VNKDREKSLKHAIGIDFPQRRVGFIAIENGFIKVDQLYEALMKQRAQETGEAESRKNTPMSLKQSRSADRLR